MYTYKKSQIIYKCYLSSLHRWIIIIHIDDDICYPIYIWNKKDMYTKNIAAASVKGIINTRIKRIERDIDDDRFIIHTI